jgi:hypothetical protein
MVALEVIYYSPRYGMVTILRDDIHDDLCGDRNNINMYIYTYSPT